MRQSLPPVLFGVASVVAAVVLTATDSHATPVTFSTRALFDATVGAQILDTYSAVGYTTGDLSDVAVEDQFTDAAMSAVLGETDYTSTAYPNTDNWVFNHPNSRYCAGPTCNGSFLLTFTSTSIGSATGVYGAAFDYFQSSGTTPLYAFVTLGDGSTASLPLAVGFGFFGITDSTLITSIHVGLADGSSSQGGRAFIDNLAVAAPVPEPATLTMLGLGLAGIAARYRRRK